MKYFVARKAILKAIKQALTRIFWHTSLTFAIMTVDNFTTLANTYLGKVESYMASNLLHIKLDKSCFMYLPPSRKFLNTKTIKVKEKKGKGKSNASPKTETIIEKSGMNISIGKIALKEVTETKFLGIIFDTLLDWNVHIK